MKNTLEFLVCFLILIFELSPSLSEAQSDIAGLDTNGIVYQVNRKTAELTPITNEAYSAFNLGATAQKGGKLYYVVVPGGSSENALYISTLKTKSLTHIDLDRNDSVRALFFKGNKLFGIFYDSGAGTAGLYKIAPKTGVTTLVRDLSTLDLEPLPGAITEFNGFYYLLAKPEIDSTQRRLLRFKTNGGNVRISEVLDGAGSPVRCDHLKPNASRKNFVCLASNMAQTEVSVCKLSLKGVAKCEAALANITRVGQGHTMLTPDQKNFYAFVYANGEVDNQRLIKFNAKGVIKSNLVLGTILIGAHFNSESPK